ncbi:hypothetical protein CAPTEDRAFT_206895 [Capitella teleta]|uniref:Uncharacterized protein n=1 Tax=Capitella teleta TaxID=283909 RepID=R7UMV5_CAPTE|nr:hypothetical protein CAPTEDRAFT_206895 [Capitella teleta]|eukprot:ELU05267.1 hypothetical protein CAPTEDRAFT_206895 [Capitella teleta]
MSAVIELHSHMHPLDTIAPRCKSILLAQKKALGLKSNLFGQACAAERIVLALNKLKFKDGVGDPNGLRLFLEEMKLPVGIIYRGNRLHVLFHLSTLSTSFVTYLAQKCPVQNDLRVKLLEDMKMPHFKTELQ